MPFVQAKCTNCGGNLEVDAAMQTSKCPFCGSGFVVENAIHHYQITHEIRDSVVNIYSDQYQSVSELFNKGNAYIRINNYDAGSDVFEAMVKQYPSDWRGWWGLLLCATKEGRVYPDEKPVSFWFHSARKLADPEEFSPYATWYGNICRSLAPLRIDRIIQDTRNDLNKKQNDLRDGMDKLFMAKSNRFEIIHGACMGCCAAVSFIAALFVLGYKAIYEQLIIVSFQNINVLSLVLWGGLGIVVLITGGRCMDVVKRVKTMGKYSVLSSLVRSHRRQLIELSDEIRHIKDELCQDRGYWQEKAYACMINEIGQESSCR